MKIPSSKTLILVMSLGTFVVVLDNTIMNVSISALVDDLDTTVSGVQAAIALNALMMAAFVLMGGKMADIIGMKKTFLIGSVIYVIGSLLASMSNNISVFILGWCAIQGFGAAMMLPNVTTIIKSSLTGPTRTQAFGMIAGINALGMAAGPIIGGFLTTYYSWRWAFRLEVGVLMIVIFMSYVIPKDALGKIRPSLDKMGVALQAAAMVFFVLGMLLISDYGLFMAKQPFVIGEYTFELFGLSIVPFLMGIGILFLISFVRWEGRRERSGKDLVVDLKLFKIVDFVKGLDVRFLQVALMAGTTFAVPLYLQVTYGLSAFETGFILLGFTLGLLITALSAAKRGLNILPKRKIEVGFLVAIIGLIIMMLYINFGDSPRGMLPGIFIYGLGLGLVTSQIVNLVMSSVTAKQSAEASGVTSTFDTLGSSVGTALIGTVLVVALTAGVQNMVAKSDVFSPEAKTEIANEMSASLEVLSTDVVSESIQENGAYEAEAVRIYDQARDNAFIITLMFMTFVSFICWIFARGLPARSSAEMSGEV